MSFICWRWMCMPLTNTASPFEVFLRGGANILVVKRTGQLAGR